MDVGIVSLIVSGFVAVITGLNFINAHSARKEAGLERFAKAENVSSELKTIRTGITNINLKLDEHDHDLSKLKIENAICSNTHEHMGDQLTQQIYQLEKISDKIDMLGK